MDKFPYRSDVPADKKYPAPRLGTVPSRGPNPNNNNQSTITGVWIHKGGSFSRGSAGCLTLDPAYWDNFMEKAGTSGDVTVW